MKIVRTGLNKIVLQAICEINKATYQSSKNNRNCPCQDYTQDCFSLARVNSAATSEPGCITDQTCSLPERNKRAAVTVSSAPDRSQKHFLYTVRQKMCLTVTRTDFELSGSDFQGESITLLFYCECFVYLIVRCHFS